MPLFKLWLKFWNSLRNIKLYCNRPYSSACIPVFYLLLCCYNCWTCSHPVSRVKRVAILIWTNEYTRLPPVYLVILCFRINYFMAVFLLSTMFTTNVKSFDGNACHLELCWNCTENLPVISPLKVIYLKAPVIESL